VEESWDVRAAAAASRGVGPFFLANLKTHTPCHAFSPTNFKHTHTAMSSFISVLDRELKSHVDEIGRTRTHVVANPASPPLIAQLFFEPSTRTSISFSLAGECLTVCRNHALVRRCAEQQRLACQQNLVSCLSLNHSARALNIHHTTTQQNASATTLLASPRRRLHQQPRASRWHPVRTR
jgi:hypothetical protein